MKSDEFLAKVRERGEYGSRAEAERVTGVVLRVLAGRITPGEVADLASQLSAPLDAALRPEGRTESYGREEFLRRVAEGTGARARTAEWDACAVLSTVAEAVSGGELNQVLGQLPSGYAVFFGKPGLSD
ncbi:DUF2267 domain-containing protein [Streptomyces sp. NPDC001739]|uniref:DUF2267 domain-containing protein n=1 Tax=Streptomyces siderophoricus TaxID=2802281 RepID=A0ABS1MZK2_9ACTN|nr:DUF2267 domain-containing protein [Streptomyces sp. 9-7]MBL1093149.1 DUF2267 domain-containing protein [Streptomyces sp. 9-7]